MTNEHGHGTHHVDNEPAHHGQPETQTQWNERYSSTERLFVTRPNAALVEFTADLSPGTALDVGAGEGRNSIWLAQKGWDVTALDISSVAIGRLREAAESQRLEIHTIVSDVHSYQEQGKEFDLVVLAYIHFPPEERDKLFREVSRAIAPGGHLFVVGHHLDSLGAGGPPFPERLYTPEMLRNGFPGLKVDVLEAQVRESGDRDVEVLDVVLWASRQN